MHRGRQLTLASLGFSAFPALYLLPKQRQVTHSLALDWVFLGGHPQAQSHLFRIFPKFLTSSSVSRASSAPAEVKQMSPGHPTHVRKLAQASQLCNEHKSVRKAENTRPLSSPPVYKGRSKAPRLRSQPEDSEAQQVPDEPQRTQGSRIWKLPLAARHAFYKSRGTNCILPLLSFGPAPKGSLCRAGRRKPTTPREQRAGDSPGLGLVPLSLAPDSSLKIPTKPFPLRLCPKSSAVQGLHTIQWPRSQTLLRITLLATAVGDGSTAIPGKLRGKAMGGQTCITSFAQFSGTGSSPAAGCRGQTQTEEDYFEI